VVDAWDLLYVEAAGRFLVGLVFGIGGGAFRGERLEIEAVRQVGRVCKAGAGELLDGDPAGVPRIRFERTSDRL
jgi:hypothetical protein